MDRKLKILKGVLLLRRVNRSEPKEKQIAFIDKVYTDEMLDEWINQMRSPNENPEDEDVEEADFYLYEDEKAEDSYCPSSTSHDYSPSHPWDAPGMSIKDFIRNTIPI